jgi:hypothetical protein
MKTFYTMIVPMIAVMNFVFSSCIVFIIITALELQFLTFYGVLKIVILIILSISMNYGTIFFIKSINSKFIVSQYLFFLLFLPSIAPILLNLIVVSIAFQTIGI